MAIASEEAAARAAAGSIPERPTRPDGDGRPRSPLDDGSLAAAWVQARELLGFYVQTRIDRVRMAATDLALRALLIVALAVVGLAVLAAGAFFLIAGAVQALASAVHAPGVAALIVGGGIVALAGGGVWCFVWWTRRALRRRLLAKYRDHHARQRDAFGEDVATMAGRPQASMAAREARP